MENNKYYTPDITDLRVGYECEVDLGGGWESCEISGYLTIQEYHGHAVNGKLRVPYLTREDIEKEGWEMSYSFLAVSGHIDFKRGDIWADDGRGALLEYYPAAHRIKITTTDKGYNADGPNNSVKYNGTCRCTNDFRLICKMLGI